MEISTEENEVRVRSVCEVVERAIKAGKQVQPYQQTIYDIDYLLSEVNSGASFEQYFRWASVEKIKRIQKALNTVDLKEVLELTKQAIKIAFPNGIPNDEDEKNNLTYWSEEQEESLDNLFKPFLDATEKITNTLAHYAMKSNIKHRNT